MQIVLGPVLVRKGGYAFDCWTPQEGFSRGYTYGRIEDAYYARNVEIRSRNNESSDQTIACSTVDEFVRSTMIPEVHKMYVGDAPAGRSREACRNRGLYG
jgi:hypothetical protein